MVANGLLMDDNLFTKALVVITGLVVGCDWLQSLVQPN